MRGTPSITAILHTHFEAFTLGTIESTIKKAL